MTQPRSKPSPRLEIREICAVCGKTILPGHATVENLRLGAVIHARCEIEDPHA